MIRRMDQDEEAARLAAASGGASGAIIGGATSLLTGKVGKFTPRDALIRALLGGLGGAAISGGSSYLGSQVMGAPNEDDFGAYARRGAVGGALAGGAAGGLAGAALGSRVWKPQTRNVVLSFLKKAGPGKAALLGALGGGAIMGHMGGDEGMQVDILREELKRAKLRQAMGD